MDRLLLFATVAYGLIYLVVIVFVLRPFISQWRADKNDPAQL
jgi:hypothetical protein